MKIQFEVEKLSLNTRQQGEGINRVRKILLTPLCLLFTETLANEWRQTKIVLPGAAKYLFIC